jgi:hypothetical protein
MPRAVDERNTRELCDAHFVLSAGLTLHALTEREYLSLKLQDRKVTLPEAQRFISQKCNVFLSVTQNSREFYQEAQNIADKLEFLRN